MVEATRESELIAAAKGGDRLAVGQLLLMHSEALSRHLAVKMPPSLKRVVSVEDILQQTFCDAFRDIEKFTPHGPGSFYAWLKVVGQHKVQNAIKSAGRQKRGGHMQRVEAVVGDNASMYDLVAQLAADGSTPSMALKREEALSAMNIALAELPDDYRDVIRMRFLEGRSIDDTAKYLGRSPAAVRALVDRAKKRLREAMGTLSRYMSLN